MKKIIFLIAIHILLFSCTSDSTAPSYSNDVSGSSSGNSTGCGTHNGKQLYKGSSGGCYYYNSSGNKTYVDRSECKC